MRKILFVLMFAVAPATAGDIVTNVKVQSSDHLLIQYNPNENFWKVYDKGEPVGGFRVNGDCSVESKGLPEWFDYFVRFVTCDAVKNIQKLAR